MGLVNRKTEANEPGLRDSSYEATRIRLEHEALLEYMKPYSDRHPVKHWAFARIDPATMRAIGECPEEFDKFRDGFRNAIGPNDVFEDLMACKMVEARWRQFRLLKAEAAILAQRRCQFVIERQRQLAKPFEGALSPSTGPVPTDLNKPGTTATGADSGPSRFTTLVKFLKTVRAAVVNDGFQGASLKLLEAVSGSGAAATATLVAANYQQAQAEIARDHSAPEEHGKNFLTWLDTEIAAFEGLAQLDCAAETELSAYAFDARLLLPDKELDKIRRYQMDTQREFDNAFKRLMEWRKTQADLQAQRAEAQRQRERDKRR